MSLSVIALVIALCSLIWNIISTAYTWAIGKPSVRLTASSKLAEDRTEVLLQIAATNIGGSPVGIRNVSLWWQFDRRSRTGVHIDSTPDANVGTYGPALPCTLTANHAQRWQFDVMRYLGEKYGSEFPRKLLLGVQLETGREVLATIATRDFFDFSEIKDAFERESNTQKLQLVAHWTTTGNFFRNGVGINISSFYRGLPAAPPQSSPEISSVPLPSLMRRLMKAKRSDSLPPP